MVVRLWPVLVHFGVVLGPPHPCVARPEGMFGGFRVKFGFWTGHVQAKRPLTLHAGLERLGWIALGGLGHADTRGYLQ